MTAASLSTADAGYIENDDEPWHSTCVSKAPVITKGAFDQAYVSSLPFVAPEEALQLGDEREEVELRGVDLALERLDFLDEREENGVVRLGLLEDHTHDLLVDLGDDVLRHHGRDDGFDRLRRRRLGRARRHET